MDFGMAHEAVKAALALGRKIEFVQKVVGISEEQRLALLAPLVAKRLELLSGKGVQGSLDLDGPKGGRRPS